MKAAIKLLLIVYAAAVGIVGQFAASDSADLGYPSVLVLASSLSYLSLTFAVLFVCLGWKPTIVRHWRPIFWLSVADFLLGLWMDATIPEDFNAASGASFWITVVQVCAFVLPAYFFSYVVAYRKASSSTGTGPV